MATRASARTLLAKLKKIEQAIKSQRALRGTLRDEDIKAALAPLEAQRDEIKAALKGAGAAAQAGRSQAVGARGVGARKGIRKSTIITGDRNTSQRGKTNIKAGRISKSAIGDNPQVHIHEAPRDAGKTSPRTLREAYLKRLVADIAPLRLSGIDPKSATERQAGELQLSAVYTGLYTRQPEQDHILDQDEASAGRERQAALGARDAPRLSALAALNRHSRLVLLGDPGSGKSTFVNFVALCMAGQMLKHRDANLKLLRQPLPVEDPSKRDQKPKPQPWAHGALLPVRVVLRDFAARGLPAPGQPASGDTLWQFIVAELGASLADCANVLRDILLDPGGLILFDGLDEVPDAHQRREQVREAVQGFARDFPACRILVTSRTYAYQRGWKLDGFAEAVLSPFTPAQIGHFVDRWYAHVGPLRGLSARDAEGKAAVLKTAIQRSARLSELAPNPLLLTLMASLHAWRGGSLPEKREELYADAVDLLLDQWESQKLKRKPDGGYETQEPSLTEYLKVGKDAIRAELNRIAFEAHRDQPRLSGTADIPHERLIKALLGVSRDRKADIGGLDRYLRERSGLLAARAPDIYAFPHRTFQEYLAACHLTDAGFPRDLVRLVNADVERWREVTLLAGAKAYRGTASAVWNLAEALCAGDPPQTERLAGDQPALMALLAAQTLIENEGHKLADVDAWNRPKLDRIHKWMRTIVERGWLTLRDRAQAGNALAALGDDRDLEALVEVPAGPFLMGSAHADDLAAGNEKPQHEVTLPAFKIGRYPVTNAQYLRFVDATGRRWRSDEARKPERASHPAVRVSWHDARAYCAWLTQQWRAQGRIGPDEEVRLPSEAEWEKAARGTHGRIYPWGDAWDADRCNTRELGLGETTPVGIFPRGASPYGCLDMVGNVWEWTCSLSGSGWGEPEHKYPYVADDGRENLEASDKVLRVLRGGSFDYFSVLARCASRLWYSPNFDIIDHFGFRVVVSPISPASAPSAGSGQAL